LANETTVAQGEGTKSSEQDSERAELAVDPPIARQSSSESLRVNEQSKVLQKDAVLEDVTSHTHEEPTAMLPSCGALLDIERALVTPAENYPLPSDDDDFWDVDIIGLEDEGLDKSPYTAALKLASAYLLLPALENSISVSRSFLASTAPGVDAEAKSKVTDQAGNATLGEAGSRDNQSVVIPHVAADDLQTSRLSEVGLEQKQHQPLTTVSSSPYEQKTELEYVGGPSVQESSEAESAVRHVPTGASHTGPLGPEDQTPNDSIDRSALPKD